MTVVLSYVDAFLPHLIGVVVSVQEVEFERDVFAGEIARLTLLVKRLKQLCNHAASLENRDEIGAMMEQAKKLEAKNKELEEEEEVCKQIFPFQLITTLLLSISLYSQLEMTVY